MSSEALSKFAPSIIAVLVLGTAVPAWQVPVASTSHKPRQAFVQVLGRRLISPNGTDFRIRSIGVGSLEREPSEKDYAEIAALNLNTVTVVLDSRDFYDSRHPSTLIEAGWQRLDQHLALARKHRLYVILQMCGAEGAQFIPIKGQAFDYQFWVRAELQERLLEVWQSIAKRYRDEPQVLGYGLLCEPVVAGTNKQWIEFAQRAVSRIRGVDENHILFVERLYGEFGTRREISGVDFSPERSFSLVSDRNVVYQFYFFERDEYTHQHAPWREDRDQNLAYPNDGFEIVYRESGNDRGRVFHWNKEYLSFYLERQLEFGRAHDVPMFVWAFGLMKNCFEGKGGLHWLRDVTELFDSQNLSWGYSDYRDEDFGISDNLEAKSVLASTPPP